MFTFKVYYLNSKELAHANITINFKSSPNDPSACFCGCVSMPVRRETATASPAQWVERLDAAYPLDPTGSHAQGILL